MDHADAVRTYAVEGYTLEELNEFERNSFEAHMMQCVICAEEARIASELATALREAFEEDPSLGISYDQNTRLFRQFLRRFFRRNRK